MFLHYALRRPVLIRCTRRAYASAPSQKQEEPVTGTSKASEASAKSSCIPNTVIDGVNYLKGQEPVIAKPDDEYPAWLWTILAPKVYPDDGPGGKAERVQRRRENKQRIKDQNFMKTQ